MIIQVRYNGRVYDVDESYIMYDLLHGLCKSIAEEAREKLEERLDAESYCDSCSDRGNLVICEHCPSRKFELGIRRSGVAAELGNMDSHRNTLYREVHERLEAAKEGCRKYSTRKWRRAKILIEEGKVKCAKCGKELTLEQLLRHAAHMDNQPQRSGPYCSRTCACSKKGGGKK